MPNIPIARTVAALALLLVGSACQGTAEPPQVGEATSARGGLPIFPSASGLPGSPPAVAGTLPREPRGRIVDRNDPSPIPPQSARPPQLRTQPSEDLTTRSATRIQQRRVRDLATSPDPDPARIDRLQRDQQRLRAREALNAEPGATDLLERSRRSIVGRQLDDRTGNPIR